MGGFQAALNTRFPKASLGGGSLFRRVPKIDRSHPRPALFSHGAWEHMEARLLSPDAFAMDNKRQR